MVRFLFFVIPRLIISPQEWVWGLKQPPLDLEWLDRGYLQFLRMILVEGSGDPRLLHSQQVVSVLMGLGKRVRESDRDGINRLLVECQEKGEVGFRGVFLFLNL